MVRPAGWQWRPLDLGSDPVPGDPNRIEQEAAHLAAVARQVHDQVTMLDKIAAGAADGTLRGEYAAKIHSAAADLAKQLGSVPGYFKTVSDALYGYLPDLEQAQAWSIQALNQAEGPHQQLNSLTAQPSPSQPAVRKAQSALGDAKALLAKATSLRDNSATYHAQKIRSAMPDDRPNWFASLVSDAGSFFNAVGTDVHNFIETHVALLQFISGVLGLIAGIASLLALIPPLTAVFAPIALAAGLAATIIDICLAQVGDGSWVCVAFDVVGDIGGIAAIVSTVRIAAIAEDLGKTAAPGFWSLIFKGGTFMNTEEFVWRSVNLVFSQFSWTALGAGTPGMLGELGQWIGDGFQGRAPWQQPATP